MEKKRPKAKRKYFKVTNTSVESKLIEFEFYPGFSPSQKIKNFKSMHDAIKKENDKCHILEVSTKSDEYLGKKLSAFNLRLDNKSLEQVFQESKIFRAKNEGFIDIVKLMQKVGIKEPTEEVMENIVKINDYCVYQSDKIKFKVEDEVCFDFANFHPRTCKKLIAMFLESYEKEMQFNAFKYKNEYFELNAYKKSQTLFYDYIYFKALQESLNQNEIKQILNFNIFTDIEFNHNKSINCQARSCAFYHYALKLGKIDYYLQSKSKFEEIYEKYVEVDKADSLF